MSSGLREDASVQFIRTPRYLWPFNSAASAFWPPLGFCSLAAAVRERFPKLRVSILDCPAAQVGWKTLERRLRTDPPDVVCIGEETVSSAEGLRLARLVKTLDPGTVVIGGGVYFGHAVEETFAEGTFDYIVRGEGEATLVELIAALLASRREFGEIRGLAWRDDRADTRITTLDENGDRHVSARFARSALRQAQGGMSLSNAAGASQRFRAATTQCCGAAAREIRDCHPVSTKAKRVAVPRFPPVTDPAPGDRSLLPQLYINPLRAPIMDLDSLPRPAYDLLDVAAYGRGSRNHPAPASLEHSRGCTGRCNFCILWKHFGAPDDGRVVPCYRTKSPERTFDEVKWLATEHGRKTIHFVDPCFNTDPAWTDEFAGMMLAANLGVQLTAWMRADFIVRDEALGIMEKLVRAGLVQAYIGVERADERDLAFLGRNHNGPETTRRAFEILRTRYPEVFTIGTIIYGLPSETKQSLAALRDIQYDYPIDYAFYIPLTPNPGTEVRETLRAGGYKMSDDFREYNFFTPVVETDHLSRAQLADFYSDLLLHVSAAKLRSVFHAAARSRGERVRRVFRNLATYALKVGATQLVRRMLRPLTNGTTLYAKKPKWYDG